MNIADDRDPRPATKPKTLLDLRLTPKEAVVKAEEHEGQIRAHNEEIRELEKRLSATKEQRDKIQRDYLNPISAALVAHYSRAT